MSEQAACKGKGHQSQREFVHIQRGKQPPKCPKYSIENAKMYKKFKTLKMSNFFKQQCGLFCH